MTFSAVAAQEILNRFERGGITEERRDEAIDTIAKAGRQLDEIWVARQRVKTHREVLAQIDEDAA